MTLLISVVTAVYNRQETLGDTLDSVRGQTYPYVEHIIQDGGSTDGTLELLKNNAAPRTSLISEPDNGIYDAINKGIKRSHGDIVGLMHSDDFFASPDILEKVANCFHDTDIDGIYGDLNYVSAQDPDRIIRRWKSGSFEKRKLRFGWMPPHPTLYLRREVFDRLGLYDTQFSIAADYDAMLRYLTSGQVQLGYLPEVMVKMRVGGESNKTLRKILKKTSEDYRAIRQNGVGGVGTLVCKNLSKARQFL